LLQRRTQARALGVERARLVGELADPNGQMVQGFKHGRYRKPSSTIAQMGQRQSGNALNYQGKSLKI